MKNFFFTLCALFISLHTFAQLNGDGYYRIKNVGSQRYLYVTDDKGSIDAASASADLGAVKLYRDFSKAVSDPSTILYIKQSSDGQYRFEAQGTDSHEIIGYDLLISAQSDGTYKAYQQQSFLRMYLSDARIENTTEGVLSTKDMSSYPNYLKWNITPVSSEGTEYFGFAPDVNYADFYYGTLYASFPYSFASSGMTAYYVSIVENGVAVISPLTDNAVPAGMPVIIRTSSKEPVSNKFNIVANSVKVPNDNKLGGVYFCNTSKAHNNVVAYDANTMRVLGLTSSGKLGFIKATNDMLVVKDNVAYLPANKAYLIVSADTPDQLEVMTKDEYDNRSVNVTVTTSMGGSVTGCGSYKVNTQVTLTAIPNIGYHFEKWSDGSTANPYTFTATSNTSFTATFAPSSFELSYILDGVQYHSEQVVYGNSLMPISAPVREGYTFSGWSEIPTVMPAHDVTVIGTFIPNVYQITYMVDGEVYKIDSLACDAPFKVEPIPSKEGYNFDGWNGVPTIMPASDIVLSGTFVVNKDNKFNVIYMVDGQEYKRVLVSFGDVIALDAEPTKEGYTFSGWSEIPETMPLQDVIVIGEFVINSYTLTYMVDDTVYATEYIEYGAPIVLMNGPEKDGFIFEGWTDAPTIMPATDIVVLAVYTDGIDAMTANRLVDVYTLQGVLVKSKILLENIRKELPKGIYIVNGCKLLIK